MFLTETFVDGESMYESKVWISILMSLSLSHRDLPDKISTSRPSGRTTLILHPLPANHPTYKLGTDRGAGGRGEALR